MSSKIIVEKENLHLQIDYAKVVLNIKDKIQSVQVVAFNQNVHHRLNIIIERECALNVPKGTLLLEIENVVSQLNVYVVSLLIIMEYARNVTHTKKHVLEQNLIELAVSQYVVMKSFMLQKTLTVLCVQFIKE